MAAPDCTRYRPRVPQATPLYRLVQACYADVRDSWEERYEGRYGFWRSFMDKAVGAYLDCGILENGFTRVRCGACHAEFLVAYSCKGRGLCPSCAAKRAAALAAFLREEVLADVGHAQWVFSIPKMLRPYLLYHRPLLGRLCQVAYKTAREMIGAASPDGELLVPGMIAVVQTFVQTFGDDLAWHPHVHALVTRGGWTATGEWVPVPFVDGEAAALVFRHRVFRALRRRWAELLRRIYEVDPLVCPRCGETMRIIAFITEPRVITKILRHLATKAANQRSPPQSGADAA